MLFEARHGAGQDQFGIDVEFVAHFRLPLLRELRRARSYTQETIAEILGITQPEVSKIERRADMYISPLRRYIEATGGRLDITAHFPDGDAVVINFAPEPDADNETLSVA